MLSAAGLGKAQQAELLIVLLLAVGNGAWRPSGFRVPGHTPALPQAYPAAEGAQRHRQASLSAVCVCLVHKAQAACPPGSLKVCAVPSFPRCLWPAVY